MATHHHDGAATELPVNGRWRLRPPIEVAPHPRFDDQRFFNRSVNRGSCFGLTVASA